MNRILFGCLASVFLFPSCSGNSPDISVVCEENSVGNHIIKWETTPVIPGKVKIYASTDPNRIMEKALVASADISDQRITIVSSDPTERFYYKLVFDNRYRKTVGSRNVNIPGIQNFRDIGGLANTRKKTTQWGLLYRSGQIESLSYSSHKELKNMGIKTIIDLRSEAEIKESPRLVDESFNIINIPISTIKTRDVVRDLRSGKIKNDSVYRLMVRINQDMVTYFRKEYRQVFDVLLEEDNYPLVISCTTGKGRTAIASALVLSALGMSDDVVMSDYRMSNDFFDIPSASGYAYNLPFSSQEAITTLFTAREGFLDAARQQIEKNYGDVTNYLHKGIGLTEDEIKHLKNILLN
ncbi:tyrosine-protein phosphatase [Bacteroides sp. 519]|uniref:tyrosine-protein phosphatase n=1 Tax=Bacteroides sp. 519 TaxID=2302937 RepID=UPI0013D8D08F|nr:tyrosine-protein phosphatase [Bacteroides sp. 519]NDV58083.1 tyrosine-protein phosphatase [Bacteroides sp. 519]